MTANLPISDEEYLRLKDSLVSAVAAGEGMLLSQLDGFLTAIAIGPEEIPPEEWLPRIWLGRSPRWASPAEAEDIYALIFRRYDEIRDTVAEGISRFTPVFWKDGRTAPGGRLVGGIF
jgi:uncharacterized protein